MNDLIEPTLALSFNWNNAHAIFSLVAGILILAMPKLLNYIVAIYLIAVGVMGIVS